MFTRALEIDVSNKEEPAFWCIGVVSNNVGIVVAVVFVSINQVTDRKLGSTNIGI